MSDNSSADSPPLHLRWSGLTDRGRVRANNEDAFLTLAFDSQNLGYLGKNGTGGMEHQDYVFAVSDGMGGAKSGEFASKIAVEKIPQLLPASFRLHAQGLSADFADILPELFERTHQALTKLGESYMECDGMGATLTLAWFTPGWMYFGHLGDSRLYYLPAAGGIRQITRDDTHVGWLRRNGQLNEREARNHPRRNVLQQALGARHMFIDPHVGAVGCEPGDCFLLCSDGLIDGLWDRSLEEEIRSPTPALAHLPPAERLVRSAVAESGRDNTTAVVVEVGAIPFPDGTA